MKKIELLSPAGNMECLKAAINAGCDAVYLSGKLYGARSFAGNFSNDELIQAVRYAHLYGVKVYVTINTIVYEKEVEKFIEYVRFIHQINVDAVIVQDLGMMHLIIKKFPNLEVHASTQMHIHNFEGALFAKKMGIKRIVMARETPIEVIRKIKDNLDIEVEVFAHGALCISYSGGCLMSALIGPRSGNRGTCSQACRKKYDLYDESGNKLNKDEYLLSTKELCTLQELDKIISNKVDSIKIEGRMKRPEYVYLVTKIYKKVIDNYYNAGTLKISENDIIELKKIFNRGFTRGFMLGENNDDFVYQKRPNHIGIKVGKVISYQNNNLKIKLCANVNLHDGLRIIDDKEDKGIVLNKMLVNGKLNDKAHCGDVITIRYDKYIKNNSDVLLTTDYDQIKRINEELKIKKRKVFISIYVVAKVNEKVIIKASDGKNIATVTSNFKIEKSKNKPIDKNTFVNQLKKTGNTVYEISKIEINMDENIFINIKDINELRRSLLMKLDEKRLYKIPFIENEYNLDVPSFENKRKKSVFINEEKDYLKLINKYDTFYSSNEKLLKYDDVIYKLPRVINEYPNIKKNVLIGEVGGLVKYNNFETDFSFNVVNSYSVAFLHHIGSIKVTLSHELNKSQIRLLIENYKKRYNKNPNVSVIIDSYPEAMITKFDLNKMYGIKKGYLQDEFGNKYKLISNDNFMTIYHYNKINNTDNLDYYEMGVNDLRINL